MDLPQPAPPCPPAASHPLASQPPGTNIMDAQQRRASTTVAQPASNDQGELCLVSSLCNPLHGGAPGPQGDPPPPTEVRVRPIPGSLVGVQESTAPVPPSDGFIALH